MHSMPFTKAISKLFLKLIYIKYSNVEKYRSESSFLYLLDKLIWE
jgi:hypothetical protein